MGFSLCLLLDESTILPEHGNDTTSGMAESDRVPSITSSASSNFIHTIQNWLQIFENGHENGATTESDLAY